MQLQSTILIVLVAQLGSPNFRTRETVTGALKQMGAASLMYLEMVEHSKDKEVAIRAKSLINHWYKTHAIELAEMAIKVAGHKRIPWIVSNYPSPVAYTSDSENYLASARKKIGTKGPPDWEDYRLATRMYVEDLCQQRVPQQRIVAILDHFTTLEATWIANYGNRFDPPIPPLPK